MKCDVASVYNQWSYRIDPYFEFVFNLCPKLDIVQMMMTDPDIRHFVSIVDT